MGEKFSLKILENIVLKNSSKLFGYVVKVILIFDEKNLENLVFEKFAKFMKLKKP